MQASTPMHVFTRPPTTSGVHSVTAVLMEGAGPGIGVSRMRRTNRSRSNRWIDDSRRRRTLQMPICPAALHLGDRPPRSIPRCRPPQLRRVATAALLAAFIVTMSGCTFVTSIVGPDRPIIGCPDTADLGPGHISVGSPSDGGFMWKPAANVASLRLAVTSSDAGQPITMAAGTESFGVVWDGSRSTGTSTIPWSGSNAFILFVTSPTVAHMTWWIMAIDSAGNEVGFDGCLYFPW